MSAGNACQHGGDPKRYYGKYRGLVIENIDPMQIGRVMVQVPDVLGEIAVELGDAMRSRGGHSGGCFIVPPIGSQVWIEFEQGDPDYPIWTGGFWGLVADVPVFATAPPAIPPGQNIVLQTTGQNTDPGQRRGADAGDRRDRAEESERAR